LGLINKIVFNGSRESRVDVGHEVPVEYEGICWLADKIP